METKEKRLTLESTIAHVRDFHDAFGIENASQITARLSEQDYMLRHNLIKEENDESIFNENEEISQYELNKLVVNRLITLENNIEELSKDVHHLNESIENKVNN